MRQIAGAVILILFGLLVHLPILSFAQPVIIGQPADTAVCIGGNAHFAVLAVNAVTYQWQENDGVGWYNINSSITYAEGFTTPLLKIHDANLGLNGYQYRCVVKDGSNQSAVSGSAVLGVNEPPIITLNPQDQTVCKNELALFTINALYADSYQWQESVGSGWINITDDAFYSGSTTPVLSIFTTTGMNGFRYRCRVINGNCPEISTFARLFVNPTPTLQNVTGGGSYCAGGQGLPIGLSGSETGIAYHVYRNDSPTGIVVSGNGQSISFGTFTQAGTYSVVAINGSTGCSIPMLNTVKIIVNPLPLPQTVMGGDSYCEGSQAPEVFLSSSEIGIHYQLLKNGQPTGSIQQGTGFTLNFGTQAETGFYTVSATNPMTLCSAQMIGNAQVIRHLLPQVSAGADQSIAQGTQATLNAQVSGSSNYFYQWQPAAYVQNAQQSVTKTIPLYQTRIFTVTARDLVSQCQSAPDSVRVVVTGGPLQLSLSASQNALCPGTNIFITSDASGGTGIYSYNWVSNPPGYSSNQAEINVSPIQTTTYTLTINDGNATLTKSITLTVFALPQLFELIGGGNYCSGDPGLSIILQGSQPACSYQLLRNGNPVLSKTGTGSPINFGQFTDAGTYSVEATKTDGGCSATMTGNVTISNFLKPLANAGPEQLIQQGGTALLQGSASGGSGNYAYSWTPTQYLINPTSANAATVPLTSTKQFQLVVGDVVSGCISQAAQTVVFVSGSPVLQVQITASSTNICSGEPVQLTALAGGGTGNYAFAWSSQPSGFSSDVFNPNISPDITTIYTVTVSDGLLSTSAQITITVRPKPGVFQISEGGSFCSGGAGLEVQLSDSEPNVFYSLLKNGVETGQIRQGTGDAISFGFLQENGSYGIKAFSPVYLCGSLMQGQANIQAIPIPVVDAGPDVTVPYNTTHLLTATASGGSGGYSFHWEPASLVVNPDAASTLSRPLTTTSLFYTTATDTESHCISLPDQKKVFVTGNALSVEIHAESGSICLGETLSLEAIVSGGTGSYTYYWTSEPEGYYGNEPMLNVQPLQTTKFNIVVNDGLQTSTASFVLNVKSLPESFALTGGGALCNPESYLPVGLSGSQNGAQYQLFINGSPALTLVGTGAALQFGLFNANGEYKVKASNPNNSCPVWMDGQTVISSSGQVVAEAGPDKTVIHGGQTTLDAQIVAGDGAYTFTWSPAHLLINPQEIQPQTKALQQTTVFKLTVSGTGSHCPPSVDFVTIFVQGSPLQIDIQSVDPAVCPGQPIRLLALASGGNGNYSYSWASQPSGHSSSSANPIFYPTEPTLFTVTVNDGTQVVSKSLLINTFPTPTAYLLSGGGSFCGTDETAVIQLNGSEQGASYRLFKDNYPTPYVIQGNGNTLSFGMTGGQSGIYTVEARNSQQCSQKMNGAATVVFVSRPIVVAGPDQLIAAGNIAQLMAEAGGSSGPFSWQWLPAAFLTNPNMQSTSTIPLMASRIFTVNTTDLNSGCASFPDSTFVTVTGNALNVSIEAVSSNVCRGSELSLTALAGGASGNYSYIWKDPDGVVIGNQRSIALSATKSGFYSVSVLDGSQTASAQLEIALLDSPQLFNFSGGGYLCQGVTSLNATLEDSEMGIEYQLRWNENQLIAIQYGTGNPLSFNQLIQEGNYTVVARKPENSCTSVMPGEVSVISTAPISIILPEFQTIWQGQQAQLSAAVRGGSGSFSYQWEPSNLVENPQSLVTKSVVLAGNTIFTLTVTDLTTACTVSKQQFVLIQSNSLHLQLSSDQSTVCPGYPTRLYALVSGAYGPVSYEWSSNPAGFHSTVFNPVVEPVVPTTYYITVNDGHFMLTDSIRLTTKPAPADFLVSGGGAICSGSTAVTVDLSGSENGTEYFLMRNGYSTGQSLQGNGSALSFGNITQAGQYTVKAIMQSSGCPAWMSGFATANLFPNPIADAGADQMISSGQTAILEGTINGGSGFYNYNWNPSYLTLSPHTAITPTQSLNASTVFYFHGSEQQSGCASSPDTTLVVVTGGSVTVNILPNPAVICQGESITLTAVPGGGSGNYSFIWRGSNGEVLGYGQQLSLTPEISVQVTLELTDGQNIAQSQANIQVIALPQMMNITGGGVICGNSQGVEIGLEQSEPQVAYTLFRNVNQSVMTVIGTGEPLVFGTFAQSGLYTSKAFTDTHGCAAMMAGSAVVQQHPALVADAGPDRSIVSGSSVQLEGTVYNGSGDYSFNWQPASLLLNPGSAQPISHPLDKSVMFELHVTDNQTTCQAQDQVYVFVGGGPLSVELTVNPAMVCPGQPVNCTAIPSGGSGNYSWWWSGIGSFSNPVGASLLLYPESNQWIKVTVSDGVSLVSDSAWIQVYPNPTLFTLSGGGDWCEGSDVPQITLSGSSSGELYRLNKNGYFTGQSFIGTGQPMSFSPAGMNGQYTMTATNAYGCERPMAGSATIEKLIQPEVYSFSGGGTWCANDADAGFLLSGSQKGMVYELLVNGDETGAFFGGTGFPMSIATPPTSGVYTMKAIHPGTNCGTTMAGMASALFYPMPDPSISGPEGVCAGQSVNLTAVGGEQYTWLCNPPVQGNTLVFEPTENTTLWVRVTNAFGCSDSVSHYIELFPLPDFELFDDPDLRKIIVIAPENYSRYSYLSGGQLLAETTQPFFSYGYTVLPSDTLWVRAANSQGCVTEKSIFVPGLITNDISINAFSPNSDQINDRFLAGQFIRVFNRWGLELFSGDEGWNGRFRGAVVAAGTYYYIVELRDVNGMVVRITKGSVTIVTE